MGRWLKVSGQRRGGQDKSEEEGGRDVWRRRLSTFYPPASNDWASEECCWCKSEQNYKQETKALVFSLKNFRSAIVYVIIQNVPLAKCMIFLKHILTQKKLMHVPPLTEHRLQKTVFIISLSLCFVVLSPYPLSLFHASPSIRCLPFCHLIPLYLHFVSTQLSLWCISCWLWPFVAF